MIRFEKVHKKLGGRVVLDGVELEAVLDADDYRLWPDAQAGQP